MGGDQKKKGLTVSIRCKGKQGDGRESQGKGAYEFRRSRDQEVWEEVRERIYPEFEHGGGRCCSRI